MGNFELDFVFVGPQKAGTTWIYEYLLPSPSLCFPAGVKETFFFDKYHDKGLEWYTWHFKDCKDITKKIEIAPSYFDVEQVPERVYQVNKNARIFITLRNPYERTWSLYLHQHRYGYVTGPFETAIKQDPRIMSSSMYSIHVKRWRDIFNDNVEILFIEDLRDNAELYIKNICSSLNIPYERREDLFTKKVNPDGTSRNIAIANRIRRFSNWLRSHRLHFLVNMFKKPWLHDLIYNGGQTPEGPTALHYEIMESQFEEDINLLQHMVTRDISDWHR